MKAAEPKVRADKEGLTDECFLAIQMSRLLLNIFIKYLNFIFHFTKGIFKLQLNFFLINDCSFNILNAARDTVTFFAVCPKLSFSPWWLASDWYVLIVLLSAFSVLFHFYLCFIYCLSQEHDLMQYLIFKKIFALVFLTFSYIFSLTSMCFWLFSLFYLTNNCLDESPRVLNLSCSEERSDITKNHL